MNLRPADKIMCKHNFVCRVYILFARLLLQHMLINVSIHKHMLDEVTWL